MKLCIGCGKQPVEGHIHIDEQHGKGVDVVRQFDHPTQPVRLPYSDNSVESIVFGYKYPLIKNIFPLMEELYRVAKPDAPLIIGTDYGAAVEHPGVQRLSYPGSFLFYGQPIYERFGTDYKADWKLVETVIHVHPVVAERLKESNIELDFALRHLNATAYNINVALLAQKPARQQLHSLLEPIQPILKVIAS